MNNSRLIHDEFDNATIINQLDLGIVSAATLESFVHADRSSNELALKWLELKLIELERRIKQGLPIKVEQDSKIIVINTKDEFYQWCKTILINSYNLYLRRRHF